MRTNPAYDELGAYEPRDPKSPRWVDDVIDRADQWRDEQWTT